MKVGKIFFLLNILVVCHFIISCLCRNGQTTRGNLLALKAIEQDLQQKKNRKRNLILYSLGSAALIAALVVTGIGLNMYMKKKNVDSEVQEIIDEKDEKVKEKPAEKKKTTVKIVSKRVPVKSKSSNGKSKARTVNSEVSPKLDDEKKEDLLKFNDNDLLLAAESLKVLNPKYDENTQGNDSFKNINEPRKLASFSLYDALADASEQNKNKDAESSTGQIPTPTESSHGISDGKKDTSTNDMDPLNPYGSSKRNSSEDKPTSESKGTTPESNFDSKTPEIKEINEPIIVPSYYPTTGPNPNTHGPPSRRISTSRSSGSSNRSSSGTSTRSKGPFSPLRDSSGRSSGRSTTPRVRKE